MLHNAIIVNLSCFYLFQFHGRNSYKRTAALSQFVMHRGLIISTMQAIFSAIFAFIAISLYPSLLMVLYATAYTRYKTMECYATHIWGGGEIFLCCILLLPPMSFCSVCLSFFVLYSLFGWMFDSTRCSRGMAIRATNNWIKNNINRPTEQKLKGGSNKKSRLNMSGVL